MTRDQTPTALRRELIFRLLDAHERSASFGRPTPWARDVIVKLDATSFPEAFAGTGREVLEALRAAVGSLESDRLVRVTKHPRGPLFGESKELRVGADEITALYEEGDRLEYPRLRVALERVASTARENSSDVPAWLAEFFERVSTALVTADTGVLGYSRPRFKRDARDLGDAILAAAALARGVDGWERVLSERIFRDSKRLGLLRSLVVGLLVRSDPRWEGVPPEEAAELLEAYGVRRKPGLIRCAGVGTLLVHDRSYRIEDFVPSAHLPDGWAAAWIDAVVASGTRVVTTIENEYPFLSYVDESGGPAGLGARGEIAIYTAGFPTPALVAALRGLAERSASLSFQHWGDADVGGLRIWWFLRSRIARPLSLFRTRGEWLRRESPRGGRALSSEEFSTLHRIRKQLAETGKLPEPDIRDAIDLTDALIETRTKLEQERF